MNVGRIGETLGRISRFGSAIAIGLGAMVIVGCAHTGRPTVIERTAPPPSFLHVAAVHNARVARLDRIWAHAVVGLDYRDDRGRPHHEQGEGHLQIRHPGGVGLSLGKLGETYAWLGADEEKFWFFDKFETPRVVVCRFENVGSPCAEEFGLPADPRAMLDLMGVSAIPESALGSTAWSEDGRMIIASFRRGDLIERMFVSADELLPARIEFSRSRGEPEIIATLDDPEPVVQSDEGGFFPKMASRIELFHPASGTRITLSLSDLEDGNSRRGRLTDAVFDFSTLESVFAPQQIIVLDRDCPTPALAP